MELKRGPSECTQGTHTLYYTHPPGKQTFTTPKRTSDHFINIINLTVKFNNS